MSNTTDKTLLPFSSDSRDTISVFLHLFITWASVGNLSNKKQAVLSWLPKMGSWSQAFLEKSVKTGYEYVTDCFIVCSLFVNNVIHVIIIK